MTVVRLYQIVDFLIESCVFLLHLCRPTKPAVACNAYLNQILREFFKISSHFSDIIVATGTIFISFSCETFRRVLNSPMLSFLLVFHYISPHVP